jgi:carbohydrate diacid regulator
MKISPDLAQEIVSDMKKIIGQELNFIDIDGLVIASTDPNRINTYHEGAKRVITTKEDLIIEYNEQYKGTKKGINIPIFFENKIIGVIGITGEKNEVSKYGQIIRKMTEILIKEAWLKDFTIQRREKFRTFIDYLLFRSDIEKDSFSNILDIDLKTSKDVIVGVFEKSGHLPSNSIDGLNNILEKFFSSNTQNIYTIKSDEIIIIIDHISQQSLDYTLQNIMEEAADQLHIGLTFGIGLPTMPNISIKQSYELAKSALSWSKLFSEKNIYYYHDLDLGLILNHTSLKDKKRYIHKVLSNLTEEEREEFAQIIELYGDNNGSIYKCANDLFIHKNALQYKLNKLAKLTGYNPRNLNDYVVLKIAFLLYKAI